MNDPVRPEGLFTGYYEPEAKGSRSRGGEYHGADLCQAGRSRRFRCGDRQAGSACTMAGSSTASRQGYFTRREIEEGALRGRGLELVWLARLGRCLLHADPGLGPRPPSRWHGCMRLAYAAKTGQPYTGIGGVLVERGVLAARGHVDAGDPRLDARRIPKAARELMWENKSFVFFREVEVDDPTLGPPGAQKVSADAACAASPSTAASGCSARRSGSIPRRSYRRRTRRSNHSASLMIAQDTGTAIKGHVRGDVFWGAGEKAALIAGHMKSPGTHDRAAAQASGRSGCLRSNEAQAAGRPISNCGTDVARTVKPLAQAHAQGSCEGQAKAEPQASSGKRRRTIAPARATEARPLASRRR